MPRHARQLTRTVALVGMMGSGKTAVGTAVARALGVAFKDSDHEIERAANMSVAEIFERYGEPFFREKETQVLTRLLDGPPAILSTGGGAFLSETNRRLIGEKGVALWLKADLDLLWSRVRHKTTRPLLRVPDPYAKLKSLLEARAPFYAEAGIVVEAERGLSVQQMAEKVVAALAADPAGLLEEKE
ncbi:shikimate kinase [Rhodovulum sp. YNF3179]|uniref:shikimate kinase n=1 Tax=Rhodovulum sp. YNF3179 TaxID=3425127 RepID=UPI003D358F79